jgi:RNA polymerase sigma factor (sigma-70 family)
MMSHMAASPCATEQEEKPPADVIRVLVDNHRQFLGFLEKRVGNRATAEDILQDAFVKGVGRIESLRSDESAIAWFYRLLRNAIIDHKRRAGAADRKLAAFGQELEAHVEPDLEMHGAICACVTELAATLKEEYAEALRTVEVDGVAVKDYAEQVNITKTNAGVRVHRAREALRKQVIRSCGTCADHGCLNCTCAKGPSGCGHDSARG